MCIIFVINLITAFIVFDRGIMCNKRVKCGYFHYETNFVMTRVFKMLIKVYIYFFKVVFCISESCKPFNKAECTANKRLIDPCSCTKYFLCVNKDLVLQNCPQGTAYDHTSTSSICRKEEDIYLDGICAQNKPWVRCKTTDNVTGKE